MNSFWLRITIAAIIFSLSLWKTRQILWKTPKVCGKLWLCLSYQIRVEYPVYLGKGRGREAGSRGEKTPELEEGVIRADLVSVGRDVGGQE